MAMIDKYRTVVVKGISYQIINISELGWPCVMGALI